MLRTCVNGHSNPLITRVMSGGSAVLLLSGIALLLPLPYAVRAVLWAAQALAVVALLALSAMIAVSHR